MMDNFSIFTQHLNLRWLFLISASYFCSKLLSQNSRVLIQSGCKQEGNGSELQRNHDSERRDKRSSRVVARNVNDVKLESAAFCVLPHKKPTFYPIFTIISFTHLKIEFGEFSAGRYIRLGDFQWLQGREELVVKKRLSMGAKWCRAISSP